MSGHEVRADPAEVARLGDQLLGSSQEVGDAWRGAQGALAVPRAAFGDDDAGSWASAAHARTVDDAESAIGQLVAVLEGDIDRMYRIASAYTRADERAAS